MALSHTMRDKNSSYEEVVTVLKLAADIYLQAELGDGQAETINLAFMRI
jgi:hypothetical protein